MTTYIQIDVARKEARQTRLPANVTVKMIVRDAASKIPGWKFLDRCEPAMASHDETKQIRCLLNSECENYHRTIDRFGQEKHSLKFHQVDSIVKIRPDELMMIAKVLYESFRYHLGYDLDATITTETVIESD